MLVVDRAAEAERTLRGIYDTLTAEQTPTLGVVAAPVPTIDDAMAKIADTRAMLLRVVSVLIDAGVIRP